MKKEVGKISISDQKKEKEQRENQVKASERKINKHNERQEGKNRYEPNHS